MYGWTFHQSHDQATVLFLVPQSVSSKHLDVKFGSTYIIAAVRSQPAIIKAKLYGRINTQNSTWRIGDKNNLGAKRSRSLRTTSAQAQASASGNRTNMTRRDPILNLKESRSAASPSSDQQFSVAGCSLAYFESAPPSYSSMTASTSSLQSGSNYEVLSSTQHSWQLSARCSKTFSSQVTNWSSSSSDMGSSDSASAMIRSTVLSEPDSLTWQRSDPFQGQSAPRRVRSNADVSARASLQDDDESSSGMRSSIASIRTRRSDNSDSLSSDIGRHAKGGSGHDGLSSRDASSLSVSAPATTAESEADDKLGFPAVRLVTIHLDKLDTGIWPLLVIGPAPLQQEALPPRLRCAETSSWSAGVTESLIAEQARRAACERNEQQRKHNAERELTKALGEALGTASDDESQTSGFSGSREGVQAYLDSLSASTHDPLSDPENDEDGMGPNTSTLSILSTNSDESATVLGTRVPSLNASRTQEAGELGRAGVREQGKSRQGDSEDDEAEELRELEIEAKFNMDPTTLSLIGLQVADAAPKPLLDVPSLGSTGFRAATHWALPEAFEYFARAWRLADVALATERLVQDYLPFLPELAGNESPPSSLEASTAKAPEVGHTSSSDTFRPESLGLGAAAAAPKRPSRTNAGVSSQRQRLIASLGGQKALARLYLSYARLHLPSFADSRSPLAFPHGQHNSPFVSGRDMAMQRTGMLVRKPGINLASSPSSQASSVASSHDGASPSKRSKQPSSPMSVQSPSSPGDGAEATGFFTGHSPAAMRMPGPLHFLQEAVRLDVGISTQIAALEWQEATTMEEEEVEAKRLEKEALEHAEEMGSLAGESEMGDLVFDSDGEIAAECKRGRRRKRTSRTAGPSVLSWMFGSQARSRIERKGNRRHKPSQSSRKSARTYSRSAEEEGGMIAFVSGAALLSVALAGGVAAVGWWRRASGGISTSS